MKKTLYISFLFLAFSLVSCQDKSSTNTKVYLGGQIINPNNKYITLLKDQEVIDTLQLDTNNQFGQYLPQLNEGIYTIKHYPESQIVYLKPGDSIMIWVNTYDFDQSINFSGKGSRESSYLVDLYLQNKANNSLVLSYYKTNPKAFDRVSDSIHENRLENFKERAQKSNFTDKFIDIAQQSIDYEFYDLRERYSFLITKYYPQFLKDLPKDFNNYRSKIDFNNKDLQSYYLYTNTIDDFLRAKSIEYCELEKLPRSCYNIANFTNIKRRATLIDSLSQTPKIKNRFLDILLTQAMTMARNDKDINRAISLAEDLNFENIQELKDLAKIQTNYFEGKSIANLSLIDANGNSTTYGQIINKPSIVYFWSINDPKRYSWQHKTVDLLRKKYPEIDFFGINLNMDEKEQWLKIIKPYDTNFEFQLASRAGTNKHLLSKYQYRLNFMDKNAVIIRADEQLSTSPDFEEKLVEFLNSK